MKLTYKKGFWVILVFSIVLAIYQYGKQLSLEVDLAFVEIDAAFSKSDSKVIGELTTQRLYAKSEIKSYLNLNYYASDGVVLKGDTLFLSNSLLLFKNDSLVSIIIE